MVRARYDAAADFYVRGFASVDDPASLALLEILGPVAGLHVLDVACGHGRMTRELAQQGASVVGIDISGVLISKAVETEQNEPLGIRYVHEDVTTADFLGNGEFDAVTCNFGLSDIDDLDAAVTANQRCAAARRLLRLLDLAPVLRRGERHLRRLASRRQLLPGGTLDGAGPPLCAPPKGGRQPPDAIYLLRCAPASRPVARPAH
jgi:SAM-dependent methyltransferase